MIHDGKLRGVEVIGSGLEGLAYAASDNLADLMPLVRDGLCDEPTAGGTVKWVAKLTDAGIAGIET